MRLAVLDRGHTLKTKAFLAFIRVVSRRPAPDIIKLLEYRADFLGDPLGDLVQDAMRGPSPWSVGERELMAAFVSKTNACQYCTKAHTTVAAKADGHAKVDAALVDVEAAPIAEPLRATLRFLDKLTRDHAVTADDVQALYAAGVTRPQIEDALAVCFAFNVIDRLADAFAFAIPDDAAFEMAAKILLKRGYKL